MDVVECIMIYTFGAHASIYRICKYKYLISFKLESLIQSTEQFILQNLKKKYWLCTRSCKES